MRGSDSYQEMKNGLFFFTLNQMKYICLSICGILNYFPANLIRICAWAMLQEAMIIHFA